MAYNGSVDLIAGLRPKNNGSFPLAKAHDIYVDDNTRVDDALNAKVNKPSGNGTSGQVLQTNGDGTTSWTDQGEVSDEVIQDSVESWLEDHPEATTTVQDGTLTRAKFTSSEYPHINNDYVTPEMYGAVGDGSADDTQAIQDCIDYASSHDKAVRGYNWYKTTQPLSINAYYLDLDIFGISYTGTDYCVSISGSYNNIRFGGLYCSGYDDSDPTDIKAARGIVMTRTSGTSCSWNKISVMRVFAKGHAVDFVCNDEYIIYNTFDIRCIKSDTGNCYNGEPKAGENVFMNSTCSCSSGWAIYNCGGRFYNFTMEGEVGNGIYISGIGPYYFSGFRIREMCDKLVYRTNGTNPNTVGGTLIKFAGETTPNLRFISDDSIPYEAIDVSEMSTLEDLTANPASVSFDSICNLSYKSFIDAEISFGNWDTQNGFVKIGKGMLVTGGKKICIPEYESVVTITDTDYDMRDAQVALNNAKLYPTKMIIGVDSCVIHLPASYCADGYSEFIVDQSQHLCTIYDSKSDVTPIFSGATRGPGVYRLKAYVDPSANIIHSIRSDYNRTFNDTENFVWEITRIDQTSGSSANVGITSVADYGAVGDGTTDDSEAIQDAVDENYDVYFESNKTYYIATAITIHHDVRLHGGENTVIKTVTPSGGTANNGFVISGTLKKTTTLTTDYTSFASTANSANQFTLTDMTGINVGDIMVIQAEDQYYSYARQYYYLGATLLISDIANDHLYTSDAMPWDIENTADVSVKIYDAPTVIIENLNFISDFDSAGHYVYCLMLDYCKNSIIRNCNISQMDNGLRINECVNTLVDGVNVSQTGADFDVEVVDHYGIAVYSCTNTTIQRIVGLCANSCIDMSGSIPSINSRILQCNLFSESRTTGFGMHESAYNTVVEDCVLGGAQGYGPIIFNRCRFVRSNRNNGFSGITYRGSHNPAWTGLTVSNCIFEGELTIEIDNIRPQSPIQAFDQVIDNILITDCTGGYFAYDVTANSNILSNTINSIVLRNWKNCKELYMKNDGRVKHMLVDNCTFTEDYWMNKHNNTFWTGNVDYLHQVNDYPKKDKLFITFVSDGWQCILPEGVPISLSSSDSSAHYMVCGKNFASNDPDDWEGGSVGISSNQLSRTPNATYTSAVSVNASGQLVITSPSSSMANYYLKCLAYVPERSLVKLSATLKNTGSTSASKFRFKMYVFDADTGLYKDAGESSTAIEPSAAGEAAEYSRTAAANTYVQFVLVNNDPANGAETTFEDLMMSITPVEMDPPAYVAYDGSCRDGNGTLSSVEGRNNILGWSSSPFTTSFKADLLD